MSSSPEAEVEADSQPVIVGLAKSRKKPRACDYCRRKKIRCDGAEMPEHRCSRCITQEIECTYEPVNTRPPSKSYVQVLENRLHGMEKLFNQLHPNVQIPKNFNGVLEDYHLQDNQPSTSTQSASLAPGISPPPPESPAISEELDPSDDEREAMHHVLDSLKRLPLPSGPSSVRYHGKSSNLMFLHSVIDLKQEYTGNERPRSTGSSMQEYQESTIHYEGLADTPSSVPPEPDGRHEPGPNAWAWTTQRKPTTPYRDFPPPDLMEQLVDAYFVHHEVYLPLLHRPTFVQAIQDGVHLRDQGFGGVLLLVCALGSRWVDDPRTLTGGVKLPGWNWFKQVESTRWSLMDRPRIEDLQSCSLMAFYLGGSNTPQGAWNLIGLGLRMAQDVGVHRKKMYAGKPTVEDELWKRAFWALVCIDRTASYGLGRPSAVHDEDIDAELLTEVDDEYWINPDPELAFKQPEGKPSRIAFSNCLIRLLKILAFASRTIYSINKLKLSLGYVGPEWEQKVVAELDSAMNRWVDTVPEHLRWDPHRTDTLFLSQSAVLYAHYYFLQICIHRPFIPSSRKASRLPFPSLAICTNAARSCTHVIDIQYQRTGVPLLLNRTPLFSAALVLLLNVWGAKRSGLTNQSAVNDVQKCASMLKRLQVHTSSARRVLEILEGLMSLGEFSLPEESQFTSAARPDLGALVSAIIVKDTAETAFAHALPPQHPQQAPSSSRGDSQRLAHSQAHSNAGASGMLGMASLYTSTDRLPNAALLAHEQSGDVYMDQSFTLPVRTQDLGRLPFHHGFHTFDGFVDATSVFDSQQQQQQQQHGVATSVPPMVQGMDMNMSADGFTMFANYGELLSALAMATPSPASDANSPSPDAQGQTQGSDMQAQAQALGSQVQVRDASIAMGPGADRNFMFPDMNTDMPMDLSAENLTFADNMMEMWSTAPVSLGMEEWGPYLSNMMTSAAGAALPPQRRPSAGFSE